MVLDELAVLLWGPELPSGLRYQDCAFEQRIPQHQKTDMSHMTHTLLLSLVARCLPLVRTEASAATKFRRQPLRVHRGANTCLPAGTCAQSYTRRQLC